MSTFADPATGERLPLSDLLGRLLLVTVHAVEHGIVTTFGESDAVRCDVACLDGAYKGERWENTLIFPRVLQSQLAPRVGSMVLGRLAQGTAKPGQSAPWTLNAATDDDKAVAGRYLEYAAAQAAPVEEPF